MTEEKKKISLASLMTPSKTVTIDYPEFTGMTIDLCFLAREELIKLRARCLSQKFNRKTRGFEEELDDDKFLIEIKFHGDGKSLKAAVKKTDVFDINIIDKTDSKK